MPVVTVQITREGTTPQQKAEIIQGMTNVLSQVLDKPPALTHVLIQEVDTDSWGVGGLPALEFREQIKASGKS